MYTRVNEDDDKGIREQLLYSTRCLAVSLPFDAASAAAVL